MSITEEEEYYDDDDGVSPKVRKERIAKRKPNPQCWLSSKKFAEMRFGQTAARSTDSKSKWREYDSKANKNGFRQLIVLDDGTEYVGQWRDNLREGEGKHYTAEGYYDGNFKDDMYDGEGTLFLWNDKTNCERKGRWAFYSGNWIRGKMDGKGVRYDLNGDTYDGDFSRGKRKGEGVMYYYNGDIYMGGWDNDLRNGRGELKKVNGDLFIGEYVNDKRNGEGVLHIEASKRRLEGVWVDDYFQGGEYFDEAEDLKYVEPTDISGTTDGLIPQLKLKNPNEVIRKIRENAIKRVPMK
jgi:hypothetical protein